MIKWHENYIFAMGVFVGAFAFAGAPVVTALLFGFESFLIWCAIDVVVDFVVKVINRGRS